MQTSNKIFKKIRIIFLSGSILILIAFACWGFQSKTFENINVSVSPIGESPDSQQFEAVKSDILADFHFLKGKSLWDLDISQIISDLKRKSWVNDVQLTRLFPNRLDVAVELKKVQLAYVDDAGIWMPIAGDGTILNKATKSHLPDVPYLRGRKFYENKNLRHQAVDLVKNLPDSGILNAHSVSEIYFEPKSGFEILMGKTGTRVILGNDNFDLKSKRVNKVLEYLEAKEIIGRVIDARFEKKILVRLRKGP